MMMSDDPQSGLPVVSRTFEDLKQINAHGAEFWSARDVQPLLGYTQWRRFEQAIERAITSCKQSENKPEYHFAGAGKPIPGGKGSVQNVTDYHLSRFACYLIAQKNDSNPRRPNWNWTTKTRPDCWAAKKRPAIHEQAFVNPPHGVCGARGTKMNHKPM